MTAAAAVSVVMSVPSGTVGCMESRTSATSRVDVLSAVQARRVALAAQGFADRRPRGVPDVRALRRVMGRIALLQIDSVNVVSRSHYLPLFSRVGPYPHAVLDRAASAAPRLLFEYWAHAASLIPVDLQPYLRFRMSRADTLAWGRMRRVARERPRLVAWVLDELRDRGPLTARAIEDDAPRDRSGWGWNWTEVKSALEWLFFQGRVTAARRGGAFERVYDLPERVLPRRVLEAPTPSAADAHRELVRVAGRALGVATEGCLKDYFRLTADETRRAIAELVEAGELLPVSVEGWRHAAYLHRDARPGRRVRACALLSPFDSLVWERSRTSRLFGFDYRLEIYVPPAERRHGYYVLPFLLGDRLVARVDLKADRGARVLRVQAAHAEADAPGETPGQLAAELVTMAPWLSLDGVQVAGRGDLAPALASALRC